MTSVNSPRPTTEIERVLLDSVDDMVAQLVDRLDGLGAEEYLWEPVADMWSVRDTDGGAVVDLGDRAADPAPVTTIAWRLWHLASDCLDSYRLRWLGEPDVVDLSWTMDPTEAVQRFTESWKAFRAAVSGPEDWFVELGEHFGPWSRHCIADLVQHASNELVHHGAEIALLRDLHRANES